jgi:RHS repeat-associated protein
VVTGKTIQWEADYFPFGSQRTVITNLADNPYQFTGYEYDSGTGYNYAVARFDAGRWGRFLSPDPYLGSMDITNPQSLNRFSYVLNNPLNLIDPLGLDYCQWDDGSFDDSPEDGGDTFGQCGKGGGTWIVETTVTVNAPSDSADIGGGGRNPQLGESGGITFGVRNPNDTFKQCMERNASSYSVAGLADLAIPGANGAVSNNFVVSTVAGNSITGTFFAFAGTTTGSSFNGVSTGAGFAGNVVTAAMGSPVTYGRRTAQIMSLNLAGKGGLPQALSSASGGAKGFLGKLGTGALKLAADVGFTLAEGLGCSIPK